MATITIRIDRETHQRLKQIAEKEQRSLRDVVNELLDHYEEAEFRRAVREGFRGLREDPAEWEEYRRELREWDATLMDGLEDESPFLIEDSPQT